MLGISVGNIVGVKLGSTQRELHAEFCATSTGISDHGLFDVLTVRLATSLGTGPAFTLIEDKL